MNITIPEGYDADKLTIVLKKVKTKPEPEPEPKPEPKHPIYESPDGGKTIYERPFGSDISERKPKPDPKPLIKIKALARMPVPIDPKRGPMARSCAFCYKPAQHNHDMCIPCQAKFRRRCSLAK